ncbi:membrane protein insertase YidC [Ferruginibacter lapsinanis]|uniref:membrane protein insertase YidC n=1 Tax=Ferruginibacter lapsinanis TaxID=563172 RepID=UPI001E4C9809|nr:membrane protein insertase YidC [Ferruginibacter lapsinanis]UEG48515.1 membrane protein insertase YidC [Ferruginibacter lapsinanis]
MGMDRNTVIGFVLIGLLMMGMFYFNSRGSKALEAEQKRIADSIERAKPKVDTILARLDSLKLDSAKRIESAAEFKQALNTPEQLTIVENEVLKISFTNRGGQPKSVELKKFKTFDAKPLILQSGDFNKISYKINSGVNKTAETADLNFTAAAKVDNADKSQTISFSIKDSLGKEVIHQYTIHPDSYLVDFAIIMNGADKLVNQNTINLLWQTQTPQVEKDIKYEKQQTHICYVDDSKYDFSMLGNGDEKKFDKAVDWLAVKQQFFITTLAAKNKFQSAQIKWTIPADTAKHILTEAVAYCRIDMAGKSQVPLQLYYGPSDYNVLKTYNNQMENIVPYGSGVFAFVKYINRHLLLPVFDFLRQNVASLGIVILLLTLFIRLLTSPILYKSYVSGAKMKALKPEIDKLKAKFGEDKQGFGMEQMKLWKSAGVSPLGGCLPALLQIPIFMSLYYFFQSNISLRGQNFLWAKDLAAHDSIYNLPFSIPFYGDHVSLFTLTAVVTSLLISIYSMSSMQDDSNPVMKYMPYIFPVLLLGVFNNLPAALTWYYTVSNTITLILQIVIQKYIIDHDKILAQIEENRKKPVKQSKLQEKIQAMQEANQKVQDLKKRNQN